MPTRYSTNPICSDCPRKKGPNQRDLKRCATCQRAANRRAKDSRHGSHIRATYGIDAETYAALLAFQSGRCAICSRATGRTKRLAVDHDHRCDAGHDPKVGCPVCVRGLLCSICNEYLGRIRDDPEVGGRLQRYLLAPPFRALAMSRLLGVA